VLKKKSWYEKSCFFFAGHMRVADRKR
jgi:hypothetical protein